MEWVETTAKTIEEAKGLALDQLGVDEHDAEFEIVDEPRAGLFGRVRGEARVRARVRPTQPRAKAERRDRKRRPERGETDSTSVLTASPPPDTSTGVSSPSRAKRAARAPRQVSASPADASEQTDVESSSDADTATGTEANGENAARAAGGRSTPRSGQGGRRARPAEASKVSAPSGAQNREIPVDPQQVGDEAKRFVDSLVASFGLSGTTTVSYEGDEIELNVEGVELGVLVGPRGATLQAVQELTRVAAQRRLGDHDTRLRVDVGGYRERRKVALSRFAVQVAEQVIADGSAKRLEPMSSPDRKAIHDALADFEGVATRSEGDDPRRCVVIAPVE